MLIVCVMFIFLLFVNDDDDDILMQVCVIYLIRGAECI